jgi:hypothetical protein
MLIAYSFLVISLKGEIKKQLLLSPLSCDDYRYFLFHHTSLDVIIIHISIGLGII